MVGGSWYYLYLVEDVFSRKITGAKVHEVVSGEQSAALTQRTVLREHCYRQPLVLHADNGAARKSQALQAKLTKLNITPLHRSTGEDSALLTGRNKVYEAARAAYPPRWSQQIRKWQQRESVTPNSEREKQAT